MSPNTRKQKTSETRGKTGFPREFTNAGGKLAREESKRYPTGAYPTRSHFRNHSTDYLERFTSDYETDSTMTKGQSSVTRKNKRPGLRSDTNNRGTDAADPVTPGPEIQSQGHSANSPMRNEEDDIFTLKIAFSDVEIALPIDFKISFVDKAGTIAKDDVAVPFLLQKTYADRMEQTKHEKILEQERAAEAHVHSHDRDRGHELGGFEMEM